MNTNTEATFVRRKFTLTEELDAELERMANNNYQGNVSLCLRQAITDHCKSLNGQGDLTIRRLTESVAHIEDQISELAESINTTADQTRSSGKNLSETNSIGARGRGKRTYHPGAQQIVAVLQEVDTPLRVADIIERVDMQPVDVRQALGHLVDWGQVFTTLGEPPRYTLAKMNLPGEGEQ